MRMTKRVLFRAGASCSLMFLILLAACSNESKAAPTKAEVTLDPAIYSVDHSERFKLTAIETRDLPTFVKANGTITPDINRTIHVTSQGSGRVVELKVRLGDSVKKGQTLMSIYSADLAGAFSDYQKALADERLTKKALERAQLLNSHGALAEKDLEQAQDAEERARADVQNAEHHVRILGGIPDRPGSLIELHAPVSGTIVEQNISGFEGIKSLDNSPNLFTIADLSQVWVVCDVYENDLGEVHLGDAADIRLNAYPDKTYHGRLTDISRVLDPTTRSAKVRIVLPNPDGSLRPGMFAVATLRSRKMQPRMVVPSTAVMRLQDKDWLFRKEDDGKFRRIEVRVIGTVSDGVEQIDGPVKPGEPVVANALEFSAAAAEQGK